jgi:uncharacterized protein YjbI with pentapeptide repeats
MEKQIYRLWFCRLLWFCGQLPFIIVAILLLAVIICVSLWNVQQYNVNSFRDKIIGFKTEITQSSSGNKQFKAEERLTLLKEVLVVEKDATIIQNGIYPPLVQVIGGAILSITASVGYYNFKIGEENLKIGRKNLKVAEEKQVTERFSKAIEHLGNDKAIEIRLGGIYTLGQIAIDSPNVYHWAIMDILSAFIREKRPLDNTDPVSIDIQAALAVIGRREQDVHNPQMKFIDLRKVNLVGIDLRNMDFNHVHFCDANLQKARFDHIVLSHACLTDANFSNANFYDVEFCNARLSNANLRKATFNKVNFDKVNFRAATLNSTNLSEASFGHADFSDASFINTNIEGAKFFNSDLSTCKYLDREQRNSAIFYESKLPDDLKN